MKIQIETTLERGVDLLIQYEANPGVVRFCKALAAYLKENYPSIPVGTTAWWTEYRTLLKDTK